VWARKMASGALASSSSSSELEVSREFDYVWKAKDVKCEFSYTLEQVILRKIC